MNDDQNTRYNQVRQKNSHNSYQRKEGYDDQEVYWRIRGVEFDIHNGKGCLGQPNLDGDWYVYHYCNLGGLETSVDKLSDGLDTVNAFRRAVPSHEVMTLFIDLKDNFEDGQSPQDLDDLLSQKLGRESLWGPPDLIAASGESTLQAAIAKIGWPLLADLQGKFIVVLTGGDVEEPGSKLNQYVADGADANERLGFAAPQIDSSSGIASEPYVIFFNLDEDHRSLGTDVFQAGFVSRTWGLDSQSSWDEAVRLQIHHLATNEVNAGTDPWARTDNAQGYPFQGIEVELESNLAEPGSIYGIEVTSGDIWGEADSFYFAYDQLASGEIDGRRETFVASPGSHVQEWAKGALLARASLAADAPYFGVIRPATNILRVQLRPSAGAETTAHEMAIVPPETVSEKTLIWLRLDVSQGGQMAQGWGSLDGVNWTLIAGASFDQPLAFQGWGASSHGSDAVRFLFGAPGGAPVSFENQAAIGSGASGSFFSGVYPPT